MDKSILKQAMANVRNELRGGRGAALLRIEITPGGADEGDADEGAAPDTDGDAIIDEALKDLKKK